MANISNNLLVKMAKGNVAKQIVYRQHGQNTHLVAMPKFDPNRPVTALQETVRNTFSNAVAYAKWAIEDPELKAIYAAKAGPGRSAFNMAVRDYSRPPVVSLVDTQDYSGVVGSKIIVEAKDDVRVASVTVRILNAEGELLEEGNAVLDPKRVNKWSYTAQQANNEMAGTVIIATALDLADNAGVLELSL